MIDDFYRNKRVLITGDTGFKGSWLVATLLQLGAKVQGFSLGLVSKPSHHAILKTDYNLIRGDIRNINFFQKVVDDFKPEIVFHLAAQSLVLESYNEPHSTFEVNFNGTLNVLESLKSKRFIKAICIVTTDKVYRNISSAKKPFTENDPLGSHDPYSASKAAAEIVTESYYASFFAQRGIGLCTARSGNVIGGGDWAQNRIVPDLVRAWINKKPLVLRHPQAVRPWQHVLETLYGYLLLTKNLYTAPANYSGAWNFGPSKNQFKSVENLCSQAIQHLGPIHIKISAGQNPKEAYYLSLNSSKALKELKWKNKLSFNQNIGFTFDWYKSYYLHKKILTTTQISTYLKLCNE